MKFAKQEILSALLILVVQMLTSFMIAYFTDTLIVFWVTYLVCKIAFAFFKKANLKKDENS